MNKIFHNFGLPLIILVGMLSSAVGQDDHYYYQYGAPAGEYYLPAPPDTSSVLFAHDVNCWIWGKSMRSTPRGAQASWESLYGIERMATVFGEAMGITITKTGTPAIWKFMEKACYTGDISVYTVKKYYMRMRPFARMNEHVAGEFDNEEELRGNGSYPSGHTAEGWSTALALAEMLPELQDTILRRGYEYGQSRVIVGAHWQSDVDAGRLASSAGFARMHTSPGYASDLAAARAEYLTLRPEVAKEKPVAPHLNRILDAPADTASIFYYGDVAAYWLAKGERDTERGQQAIADADDSDESLYRVLSTVTAKEVSAKATPHTARLLDWVQKKLMEGVKDLKSSSTFRKRPYVQLGEPSLIPEEEESHRMSSSYPSTSAALGWGIALVMTELCPERQNELLKYGYEYGYSRVIAGYHYASDVQAGRLLAACHLARMHNDPTFRSLLESAKEEWKDYSFSEAPVSPCPDAATVTDQDGNVYKTVQIGEQCWMAENMRATHDRKGKEIAWGNDFNAKVPYRYCPNNQDSRIAQYGYLYNWTAAMKVCPEGWHLPTDAEWDQLTNYVGDQRQYRCGGDQKNIAKALAERGNVWQESDSDECMVGNDRYKNNATGFSALPAGDYQQGYHVFGRCAFFWTATKIDAKSAGRRYLVNNVSTVLGVSAEKGNGYSVRCVKNVK